MPTIFRGIVAKLWAAIFFLIVLILLVYSMTLYKNLEKIYFSNQTKLMKQNSQQWAKIIDSGLPEREIQRNVQLWGLTSNYKITVFNNKGIVLFSSDPIHSPLGKKVQWEHIQKGTYYREQVFTGYNPAFNMEMTATFMEAKLKSGEKLVVMIHAPSNELKEINYATKKISLILLFTFFIVSALMALILSIWLVRPLNVIRSAAINIASGDYNPKLDQGRNDELGDLACSINNLAVKLKKTITSLNETNLELNQVLLQWKEFLSDVSHELRTPLFLINGYAEALIDQVVDEETARKEYLPVIQKETLRMQKLVNDLIRIETNTVLDKKMLNIFDLVEEKLMAFKIILQEKAIILDIDENLKALPEVALDPDRFGEVIFNLVDNAIRHTGRGGTINVSGRMGGDLEFIISDSGSGIPAQHLPHLFNRFYRVDKDRSRSKGGLGLGLAIVKKIINLHGGSIEVKSIVNKGTTFMIRIPNI